MRLTLVRGTEERRVGKVRSFGARSHRSKHDQIRQRADTIVSQHVSLLPDQVVCSLAAVITHLLWLRGAAQRCVWTVARFRVRKDEQSVIQTDLDEAGARTGVGSFVTCGGAAGAMGGVMNSVLSWAVSTAGMARSTQHERNSLGLTTTVAQLSRTFGSVFWAAVGRHLNGDMTAAAAGRIERIQRNELNALTPWAKDMKTAPSSMVVLLFNIAASQGDRWESCEMGDARAQQKWRGLYRILANFFYIINPRCNQPIHEGLSQQAYYSGDTTRYRELCGRLGDMVSEEYRRTTGIHDAKKSEPARDAFLVAAFLAGCYFKFIDDNLDAQLSGGKEHHYENSSQKSSKGDHETNCS
eukprot:COSAG06_NODE_5881_length_3230_cov_2.068349_1_plen_355_part_10